MKFNKFEYKKVLVVNDICEKWKIIGLTNYKMKFGFYQVN